MEIHKLICDVCKDELDLTLPYYNNEKNWRRIDGDCHVCSDECWINFYSKKKE